MKRPVKSVQPTTIVSVLLVVASIASNFITIDRYREVSYNVRPATPSYNDHPYPVGEDVMRLLQSAEALGIWRAQEKNGWQLVSNDSYDMGDNELALLLVFSKREPISIWEAVSHFFGERKK